MIFKHAVTHKRYTLILYRKETGQVVLEDGDGRYVMTIADFFKNYEYCWMPNK